MFILSKLVNNPKVVGVKQVKRALESNDIEAVFIAMDAESKITNEIAEISSKKHIQVIYVENMKILGDACGIDVNAATAALLK